MKTLQKKDKFFNYKTMFNQWGYSDETASIIKTENLLPDALINRLQNVYPDYSVFLPPKAFMFKKKHSYVGIKGFREIISVLKTHDIDIGHIQEREMFIEVYRFKATQHVLNLINWQDFKNDSVFHLVFPQAGMMDNSAVEAYKKAKSDDKRKRIVAEYRKRTNPHDGNQKLNKPWYENKDGEAEILDGSQHKYPRIQLIFGKTSQKCFAFCTYCFRHAQVRGDKDMFVQEDIEQVHRYLKQHKEVTDLLLTGGDAGYIPYERMLRYLTPIIEHSDLMHIKTVRMGTRALSFQPEMVLTKAYERMLNLFRKIADSGVQLVWMAHFSAPKELLNPTTVAAIRRLQNYGITVKSQSPIMNNISLFKKKDGTADIERSAKNWTDLGNILAMLRIGFHSMYCARPTGEHQHFSASLSDINKIFSKVYRSLASISRPSRYITMTSSAGKISLLGQAKIQGKEVFVLKFNEGRNMEWLNEVFFAEYDSKERVISNLKPFNSEKFFYEDELKQIENAMKAELDEVLQNNKE